MEGLVVFLLILIVIFFGSISLSIVVVIKKANPTGGTAVPRSNIVPKIELLISFV